MIGTRSQNREELSDSRKCKINKAIREKMGSWYKEDKRCIVSFHRGKQILVKDEIYNV